MSDFIKIGSALDNSIVIKDAVAEKYHATVKRQQNGRLKAIDNNTKYGTYINGVRINEAILHEQDSLQIGFSRISYQDILQHFEPQNDISENVLEVEKVNESKEEFSEKIINNKIADSNRFIATEYYERPDLLPVIVRRSKIKTKKKSKQAIRFLFIPIIAVLSYNMGNYIARSNRTERIIVPFKSYVPFVPVVENAFNSTPLLADCVKDKSLILLINESTPEIINSLSDSLLVFEKVCDHFDAIRLESIKNTTQKLVNKLLSENVTLSLLVNKKTHQAICFVCIGNDNKFSIKHYLNKRYHLQYESSFETEIFTYTDQQKRVWIPLDLDEAYPGISSFNMNSKTIFYRFDLDRCESFPISVLK